MLRNWWLCYSGLSTKPFAQKSTHTRTHIIRAHTHPYNYNVIISQHFATGTHVYHINESAREDCLHTGRAAGLWFCVRTSRTHRAARDPALPAEDCHLSFLPSFVCPSLHGMGWRRNGRQQWWHGIVGVAYYKFLVRRCVDDAIEQMLVHVCNWQTKCSRKISAPACLQNSTILYVLYVGISIPNNTLCAHAISYIPASQNGVGGGDVSVGLWWW